MSALEPPEADTGEVERRARALAVREPGREASAPELERALAVLDLTTLEGSDTPARVRALCEKAIRPDPSDPSLPHVAAICVYPTLAPVARGALAGTGVRTAAVAGGFPAGQMRLRLKLEEVREAIACGAEEIDFAMGRGAFLAGEDGQVFDEVAAARDACGTARLKVILEVGELGGADQIRRAALLAMRAGADFLKTSTGKIRPGATLASVLVLCEAAGGFFRDTGRRVGVKAAGGLTSAEMALPYLAVVERALGPEWLVPGLFRLGASGLLDDIVTRIRAERARSRQAEGSAHATEAGKADLLTPEPIAPEPMPREDST